MRGHVRKHGKGYQAIMYVGRDGEGAPKYRYFSTQPTKAEADAVLADALAARNQGAYVKPSKMTVSELLDRWLAHMEPRRPKSYGWYKYVVESHLKPGLGHIRLQDLAAMDIDDHYARELKQGRQANNWGRKKGERLSAASVHAQHRVLRAALRQAVRWRLMTLNPLDQATPPEPGRKEHRALTARQARDLIEVAEKHARHPELYILAMTSGLCQGELLGLRWSDLEPPLAHVRVALKRRPGGGFVLEEPKTEARVRTVWLLPQAVEALEKVRVKQEAEKAIAGPVYRNHGLVFAQPDGMPLHGHNVSQREFKALVAIAKLPPGTRFHDLRHTAATLLKGAGVDALTIQAILGHADLSTTQRYTAVVLDVLRDAAEKLEGSLFSTENPEKLPPS